MAYAVYNKETKAYFAGFDGVNPIWVSEKAQARHMDMQSAKTQAALFICHNMPVQRKPVRVN